MDKNDSLQKTVALGRANLLKREISRETFEDLNNTKDKFPNPG